MKKSWYTLIIALILSLFCQNQMQALSAESKKALRKAYYKLGQYGGYACGGAAIAEFGPSFAAGGAVMFIGKAIIDSIRGDAKDQRTHSIEEILADYVGSGFAIASTLAGIGVFVYVLSEGGIKFPLLGATGGVALRLLMDAFDIPDLNYIYQEAQNQITIFLTEEQIATIVTNHAAINQEDSKEL